MRTRECEQPSSKSTQTLMCGSGAEQVIAARDIRHTYDGKHFALDGVTFGVSSCRDLFR